jgi:ATP-dependent helicase/nuclease subunit B
MFEDLPVEKPWKKSVLEQIVTEKEGMRYLAEGLREYVSEVPSQLGTEELYALYAVYKEKDAYQERITNLTDAAFKRYRESGLAKAVARALYGSYLVNSVSRLETYAACAYKHFLQYGLALKEREEFDFASVDMGNVFHGVLDEFSKRLENSEYTWLDFTPEFGEKNIAEAMEMYAVNYGAGVLYSSSRNEYAITRMNRILLRTVNTLQNHLRKGDFVPEGHEVAFRFADQMDAVNIALTKEEKMRLQGRIDRIDTSEDDEHVYVKVIDYKSGNRQFDLAAVYHGLQLQLVVYMNAAMEIEAKKHPEKEIVPAALLYYHVDDPLAEVNQEVDAEEINAQILQKLRMNGVVNADANIIEKIDRYMSDKSDVIPVEKKKDGTFSARSSIMSSGELQVISDYVNRKIRNIGREILSGHKEINPYERGISGACTYCPYGKVCGFDDNIPGYKTRKLEEYSQEEVLRKMEELD